MKNKKFILGFIIGCLVMSIISTPVGASVKEYLLTKASYKVMVGDNEYTDEELPILNWEGKTYVPLAKLGDILNVHVGWNEELRQVEIGDIYSEEEVEEEISENSNDELIEATRGEFYKYLALDFGVYDENAEYDFDYITKDNEYYAYCASLNNSGLLQIFKFMPESWLKDEKLSNNEVAFVFLETISYLPSPIGYLNIPDVSSEKHYSRAIYKSVYHELMSLDEHGNFNPDDIYLIDYSKSISQKIKNLNKDYNNINTLKFLEYKKEYLLDNRLSIQLDSLKVNDISSKSYKTYNLSGKIKNNSDKKIHPGFFVFVFDNGYPHYYTIDTELNANSSINFDDDDYYDLNNRGDLLYIEYEPYFYSDIGYLPFNRRMIWEIK